MATRRLKFTAKPKAVRSFKQRQADYLDARTQEREVLRQTKRAQSRALGRTKRALRVNRRQAKAAKEPGPWESEVLQRKRRAKRGSNG